jgi:AcrR family transcriptional regulator
LDTLGMPTVITRAESQRRTREQLVDAAERLFSKQGFHATSLDAVAAEAGFTKGAVYSNFGSKDELFLALMEDEAARRVRVVENSLRTTGDLTGALAAVGAELSRRDSTWQLLFLEFWQRAVRDPEARRAFVASRRTLRARVTEVVERFLTERPVRTGWDAPSLTVVLLALANGLAVEALPDPGAVPDDLLTRVLADLVDPEQARADLSGGDAPC